ncbi:MAG: glycoside hydrolase family 88 protein [Luteolibacter sp.]
MSATIPTPVIPLSAAREHACNVLIAKIRRNITDLVAQPTTWSFDPGGDFSKWQEGFFDIGNWTTSFFTGMALIAFKETEDAHFLQQVLALDPLYQQKLGEHVANTMHDLGFLYSLHSVALYKITGEETHRALALKAAEVLASRFLPEGNYINAWGRMDERGTDFYGMAIIDCMMNLPLLHWASKETGDPKFREIAIRHSDTTLKNFIREDGSVYHAFRFDHETGAPDRGENYCGYGVESHWARGHAWAVYGFAMAYRYTGDEHYLAASLTLARKFVSLMDDEIVPPWDFRLPSLKPELHIRDSSAAAIFVCGIQELQSSGNADAALLKTREAILDRLCSDAYLDADPAVRGVVKHGQVGMAVDAYTSWGDYYLMEALARESGMAIDWW